MNLMIIVVIISILCTSGCVTAPVGEVTPTPDGCLSLEFFPNGDDSRCLRDKTHKIIHVITAIERIEPLQKKWSITKIDKAISRKANSEKDEVYFPRSDAWIFIKKYLKSDDEIWSFGILDNGCVVIRNNELFCMVVTEHQM